MKDAGVRGVKFLDRSLKQIQTRQVWMTCMTTLRIAYNSAMKTVALDYSHRKNRCIPNTIGGFRTISVNLFSTRMRMEMFNKE